MDWKKAKEKAEKIVSEMTIEEMMTQLLYDSPPVERLGIEEYNWWNEACHGVARNGIATVFPQSIGLAASFDPELIKTVADTISTEARAKYNKNILRDDREIFKGLTFWAPNVNIFRDPRWGRGQETCGEDPFLTGQIASAFISGLQGDGEFFKATACAKHFAGHSGPESKRHSFNAEISKKDMHETYLPAFKKSVEAGVAGIMGAYNRTNGEPCSASPALMKILRGDWRFPGYFVSDCGAISDIFNGHRVVESMPEAAALALKAGCDLNCGDAYLSLVDAYEEDLITEEDIKTAAVHLFTIRAALGEFEDKRPYSDVPLSVIFSKEHKELNLRAAEETLVLLENKDRFLPIDAKKAGKIAVIGPNAMSTTALEGNYNGHADEYITIAEGVRRVFSDSEIMIANGCPLIKDFEARFDGFVNMISEGISVAEEADLTILCLGLDRSIEGEELNFSNEFTEKGDRKTMRLPACQIELAEGVCDACENVVVVVLCGSCADLGEKVRKKAKAVIHGWYPGAMGGLAVAKLIAGAFSPSGKLPITFYSDENTVPEIENYSMKGRTYRFMDEKPLYPFGFGLSFTSFEFSDPKLLSENEDGFRFAVEVENTGKTDGSEKLQCYAVFSDSRTETPKLQLCGVSPVFVRSGEKTTAEITADKYFIKAVLENGERVDPDGEIKLFFGGGQPGFSDCVSYTI